MNTLRYPKTGGIVIDLVQMTKTGRLSQYVETNSEPYHWLLDNGWKAGKVTRFVESE